MRVSIVFLIHLIGFGLLMTTLVAGYLLDGRFRKEQDLRLKVYTAKLSRLIGLLSPLAALLLLLSGIGNIETHFAGTGQSWYDQGWLVAKLILFAVLVINGVLYGPRLTRSRLKIVQSQLEQSAPPNAEVQVRSFNKQIILFYVVQSLILILILYLSVFGSGKHPGVI